MTASTVAPEDQPLRFNELPFVDGRNCWSNSRLSRNLGEMRQMEFGREYAAYFADHLTGYPENVGHNRLSSICESMDFSDKSKQGFICGFLGYVERLAFLGAHHVDPFEDHETFYHPGFDQSHTDFTSQLSMN